MYATTEMQRTSEGWTTWAKTNVLISMVEIRIIRSETHYADTFVSQFPKWRWSMNVHLSRLVTACSPFQALTWSKITLCNVLAAS